MNTNLTLDGEYSRLRRVNAALLTALRDIAERPLSVPGYNSSGALLLRLAAVQSIARVAIAEVQK